MNEQLASRRARSARAATPTILPPSRPSHPSGLTSWPLASPPPSPASLRTVGIANNPILKANRGALPRHTTTAAPSPPQPAPFRGAQETSPRPAFLPKLGLRPFDRRRPAGPSSKNETRVPPPPKWAPGVGSACRDPPRSRTCLPRGPCQHLHTGQCTAVRCLCVHL